MQVQTGKCYSETENHTFMCDSIVHVYRYTVILSYTVTFQRLELLYILHRRLSKVLHHVQESCQCIFAALCLLLINPRVMLLSNRAGKIELGCFKKKKKSCFFLHKWINFIGFAFFFCCFFLFLISFLNFKKTWRYSWDKQEVQLVGFYSSELNCIFRLSLQVKSVHNIHIQNHIGHACTP